MGKGEGDIPIHPQKMRRGDVDEMEIVMVRKIGRRTKTDAEGETPKKWEMNGRTKGIRKTKRKPLPGLHENERKWIPLRLKPAERIFAGPNFGKCSYNSVTNGGESRKACMVV